MICISCFAITAVAIAANLYALYLVGKIKKRSKEIVLESTRLCGALEEEQNKLKIANANCHLLSRDLEIANAKLKAAHERIQILIVEYNRLKTGNK